MKDTKLQRTRYKNEAFEGGMRMIMESFAKKRVRAEFVCLWGERFKFRLYVGVGLATPQPTTTSPVCLKLTRTKNAVIYSLLSSASDDLLSFFLEIVISLERGGVYILHPSRPLLPATG